MRIPESLREKYRLEDGTEQVIMLVTPLWGEAEAGFEWDAELHERLLSIGWRSVEGVPSMYYFESPDSDARLVKVVDDLLISESHPDKKIVKATLQALKEAYNGELTYDLNPTSFGSYKIETNGDECKLSQTPKIVEAVRKYLPELLEGSPCDHLPAGRELERRLDTLKLPPASERPVKLSDKGKIVQQITGDLSYFQQGSMPQIALHVHRLACINACPPEGADLMALGVLKLAYNYKDVGITFHRNKREPSRNTKGAECEMTMEQGAPLHVPEAIADAATGDRHIYGV